MCNFVVFFADESQRILFVVFTGEMQPEIQPSAAVYTLRGVFFCGGEEATTEEYLKNKKTHSRRAWEAPKPALEEGTLWIDAMGSRVFLGYMSEEQHRMWRGLRVNCVPHTRW